MIELLALPAWQAPLRTLDEWVAELTERGGPVTVVRESASVSWLEVHALRVLGYAVMEGQHVEAINFDLNATDPEPAVRVVEAVAQALGWEIHAEKPDEEP